MYCFGYDFQGSYSLEFSKKSSDLEKVWKNGEMLSAL